MIVLFIEHVIFVLCSYTTAFSQAPPYMKFCDTKFQFRPCGRLSCNKNCCHNAPQGAYEICTANLNNLFNLQQFTLSNITTLADLIRFLR